MLKRLGISLILAVANSSFAVEFYDAVCGNRLYSGRRRFITQYVKRFPLPRLAAVRVQRTVAALQIMANLTAAAAALIGRQTLGRVGEEEFVRFLDCIDARVERGARVICR